MALLLLVALQSASVSAQDAALPAGTGEFKGTIQRGADGRLGIAPVSQPPAAEAASGPLHPFGSQRAVQQAIRWAHGNVGRLAGFDHGRQADILQNDIDALLARERWRKGQGGRMNAGGLTEAEQHLSEQLRKRDQEVRRHEARHYQSGRPYTQPPRFWFVTGPGGRRYAVSGQVAFVLDKLSGEVHELLHQLTVLQRAALAPQHPSEQDLAVARSLGDVIQGLRTRAALQP